MPVSESQWKRKTKDEGESYVCCSKSRSLKTWRGGWILHSLIATWTHWKQKPGAHIQRPLLLQLLQQQNRQKHMRASVRVTITLRSSSSVNFTNSNASKRTMQHIYIEVGRVVEVGVYMLSVTDVTRIHRNNPIQASEFVDPYRKWGYAHLMRIASSMGRIFCSRARCSTYIVLNAQHTYTHKQTLTHKRSNEYEEQRGVQRAPAMPKKHTQSCETHAFVFCSRCN